MTRDNRQAVVAPAKQSQALSFGDPADIYDRGRPAYPDAAIDWLIPNGATNVLDLGAGTGKLTRALVDRGFLVDAVDPTEGMLAKLRTNLPDVAARLGAAEAIPLPDHHVNAVLVAQAWHWVDPPRASAEIARVLRPGGRLGLLWNVRDDQVDWVAAFNHLVDGDTPSKHFDGVPAIGPPFSDLEAATFAWTYRIDVEGLVELAASRSSFITLPPPSREARLAEVRAFARKVIDGKPDQIALPYITHCFRTNLSG